MKRVHALVGAWAILLLVTGCTGGDRTATARGPSSEGNRQPSATTSAASPTVRQSGCEILAGAGREVNQGLLSDFAELDRFRDEVVSRLAERASTYASRTSDLELSPTARSASQDAQDALDRLATEVTAATHNQPFDAARIEAAVSEARDAVVQTLEACAQPE